MTGRYSTQGLTELVSNASATGSAVLWKGGRGMFSAVATWGGGTVKLQILLPDGATWVDVDKSGDTFVTLTADGLGEFELPSCSIRANIATSTAVYAWVQGTGVS